MKSSGSRHLILSGALSAALALASASPPAVADTPPAAPTHQEVGKRLLAENPALNRLADSVEALQGRLKKKYPHLTRIELSALATSLAFGRADNARSCRRAERFVHPETGGYLCYAQGVSLRAKHPRGRRWRHYYDRACELGYDRACRTLSEIDARGVARRK